MCVTVWCDARERFVRHRIVIAAMDIDRPFATEVPDDLRHCPANAARFIFERRDHWKRGDLPLWLSQVIQTVMHAPNPPTWIGWALGDAIMLLDAETRMLIFQTHASSRDSAIGLIAVMTSEALMACLRQDDHAPERQLMTAIFEHMQNPLDARFVLMKIGEEGISLLPPHLAAGIREAAAMTVADEATPCSERTPHITFTR
jgi:hypothetical protein